MTSLTFDLGETEHRLQSTKIKLQTRSRLHIILPDSSEHYRSLHEFVEAGFWITRGNDLKLRVRTDHDACTGVGVGSSTLEEATSRAISEAKWWSQLSLRTIRVEFQSFQSLLRSSFDLTFAITTIESLRASSEGAKSRLRTAAKVHDIKPPSGVHIGFINCIELNLIFQPPTGSPSSTLHPTLSSLLELIDMSLRHIVSSTPCALRNGKRASTHTDSKLARAPCLADVAPAIFRPGYMKAISHRGPLISRIASSLSRICWRSRSQDWSHPSFTGSDLQIQLWALLQKRTWPTTELEPLCQEDLSYLSRQSSDGGTTLFESEHECDGAIDGFLMEADVEGDEGMLDDQVPEPVGVLDIHLFEDDDLFSSPGSTPFLSQSRLGDGMMLEDVSEAEEMLLDDDDEQLFGQHLRLAPPIDDEGEWADNEVQSMEEGDLGMLF
ncbi:MAG: hypothetical protein LQ350_002725 [Teloschistes chrysophthalmus]|nr:MAG: hypothetical protein LQ350_002725 [Niorma chrysophthalma]